MRKKGKKKGRKKISLSIFHVFPNTDSKRRHVLTAPMCRLAPDANTMLRPVWSSDLRPCCISRHQSVSPPVCLPVCLFPSDLEVAKRRGMGHSKARLPCLFSQFTAISPALFLPFFSFFPSSFFDTRTRVFSETWASYSCNLDMDVLLTCYPPRWNLLEQAQQCK